MRYRLVLLAFSILLADCGEALARIQGPEFPQIKVDWVDATDPGRWRLHLTVLDEEGLPADLLESNVTVFLSEGREPVRTAGRDPLVRFDAGLPAPGFDGEMASMKKAEVRQAAVIVVAAHADVSPEEGAALLEALNVILSGLKEDARVGVVFYGDLVTVLWSPDGVRLERRDVNQDQHCLGRIRDAAQDVGDPEVGTIGCGGLFASPGAVQAGLKTVPSGQGLFPRLFGIAEIPDLMDEAMKRGHAPLDRRSAESPVEGFATGALEAAFRMLVANTGSSDAREIILLSDGRDGYLRIADVISDWVSRSRSCRDRVGKCAERSDSTSMDHGGAPICSREILECTIPRIAAALREREDVVRDYLMDIITRFRSTGVRVSVIALPGTDEVGETRLRTLALKCRGTFRNAPTVGALVADVPANLADELAGQVVIFPDEVLEPRTGYTVAVRVDDDLTSRDYRFVTGEKRRLWEGPLGAGRSFAIGKLGHGWGPMVFWAVVVGAGLLALLVFWKLGKGIVGLFKKIGGKTAKVKAPPRPAVPKLKRPG